MLPISWGYVALDSSYSKYRMDIVGCDCQYHLKRCHFVHGKSSLKTNYKSWYRSWYSLPYHTAINLKDGDEIECIQHLHSPGLH
jgi:hypothetical protein